MPSKKYKRFSILLDEGLPLPSNYRRLNNLHSVRHIGRTKLRGKTDKIVYMLALKEHRIFITFNTKHFAKLIKPNSPTVISLSPNLTNEEADLKICRVLRELKVNELCGYLIFVTSQTIILKREIKDKNI